MELQKIKTKQYESLRTDSVSKLKHIEKQIEKISFGYQKTKVKDSKRQSESFKSSQREEYKSRYQIDLELEKDKNLTMQGVKHNCLGCCHKTIFVRKSHGVEYIQAVERPWLKNYEVQHIRKPKEPKTDVLKQSNKTKSNQVNRSVSFLETSSNQSPNRLDSDAHDLVRENTSLLDLNPTFQTQRKESSHNILKIYSAEIEDVQLEVKRPKKKEKF